jgi:hypothetical protein
VEVRIKSWFLVFCIACGTSLAALACAQIFPMTKTDFDPLNDFT